MAEKIAAFRPGHLHVVSDHESELATKFRLYPESRIHCLPNAVAYSPRPTRYARFHDFPRTFGFIGELRKQKDPVTFVRAIREVVNRGVVARFLIPDQGPLFGQIQASIQRFGLHHCVDFVPTRESLSALLEQTDVAVLPSLWEGHPYSLLEAMAQGVPTIISDIPSLRVFIRDAETKQVFRAGDSHHLAQRIVDWASLDQATLERAGSMSRREVWNRYDFEQWGARLREIYRELAGHT